MRASLLFSKKARGQENYKRRLQQNRSGKAIDISKLTFSASINVIQNILWGFTLQGENMTNLGEELRELFSELFTVLGATNISDIFPVLSRFDIQGIAKRSKKIGIQFEKIIDAAIERSKNIAAIRGGWNKDGKKDFCLQTFWSFKSMKIAQHHSL
ncbi:hypothetical protein Q3G72_019636 [Acer saccharum]|nr:hypothetical protein Q3G72_019636 [Acer saccharum]